MAIPQEFFTPASMLTLTGTAGATVLVCNGMQRALNFNPRWLGLAIGEALSFYGTYVTAPQITLTEVIVALVNGFLIFATASGVTGIGGSAQRRSKAQKSTRGAKDDARQRGFWSPWF